MSCGQWTDDAGLLQHLFALSSRHRTWKFHQAINGKGTATNLDQPSQLQQEKLRVELTVTDKYTIASITVLPRKKTTWYL